MQAAAAAAAGSKMTGVMAEDQGSVKSEDSLTGRAKFLCSYGGRIMPRPHDSQLRYVGGETRILSVQRSISFVELMAKLKKLCNNDNVSLKYQLPNEDLDALVSVLSEEDLENMMEEYDRIESKDSSSRLRLFLFPSLKQAKVESTQDHPVDVEHKFMEAVNGLLRKTDPAGVVAGLQATPTGVDEARRLGTFVTSAAHVQPPVAALGHHGPAVTVPHVGATQAALAPQLAHLHVCGGLGAQTTLPQHPVAAPASPLLQGPQAAQVLTTPANVAPNVVAVPVHSKVAAAALAPTAPFVRLAPPATPPIAVLPSPVVHVIQRPAAAVTPQVAHATASSKPVYVPLVDVSRGMLPKGMVLRQYSLEDDHADSVSSSSQPALHGNPDLRYLDRRDYDELTSGVVDVHPPKIQVQDDRYLLAGGGQSKVSPERHFKEPTMGETSQTPQHLHSDSVQRTGSAPQLPTVDVVHGKHLHRQFSDHHPENPPGGVRPGVQVSCVHVHSPLQPAVVATTAEPMLPMDPKPVLHQMNGLVRQQRPHQQHPVVHPEHKVVPQFVHPFQN